MPRELRWPWMLHESFNGPQVLQDTAQRNMTVDWMAEGYDRPDGTLLIVSSPAGRRTRWVVVQGRARPLVVRSEIGPYLYWTTWTKLSTLDVLVRILRTAANRTPSFRKRVIELALAAFKEQHGSAPTGPYVRKEIATHLAFLEAHLKGTLTTTDLASPQASCARFLRRISVGEGPSGAANYWYLMTLLACYKLRDGGTVRDVVDAFFGSVGAAAMLTDDTLGERDKRSKQVCEQVRGLLPFSEVLIALVQETRRDTSELHDSGSGRDAASRTQAVAAGADDRLR